MSATTEDYELARHASLYPHVEVADWPAVAGAVVRTTIAEEMAQGTEVPDPEGRAAFTQAVVERIFQSGAEEPVVFYRHFLDAGNAYRRFVAVVPEPAAPISIDISRPDDPLDSDPYSLHVKMRTKPIGMGSQRIAGAREIVFNDTNPRPVWMGTGTGWDELNPDKYYTPDNGSDMAVAVGNEAIAELFDRLYDEPDVNRKKLCGALFHVAWLADDFEVALPRVSTFGPELTGAKAKLEHQKSVAADIMHFDQAFSRLFGRTSDYFIRNRQRIMDEAALRPPEATLAGETPLMGPSVAWPNEASVSPVKQILEDLAREQVEQEKRIEAYAKWLHIAAVLSGEA